MKIELIDSNQAAAIDKYTIDILKVPSLLLMEEAAKTAFNEIIKDFKEKDKFFITAAAGNNGADALAVARMLYLAGYTNLDILLLGSKFTKQNETQQEMLKALGLTIYKDLEEIKNLNKDYDCIIDGLFGVGLKRDIEGKYKELIDYINSLSEPKPYVIALDLPSGLDASTSKIYGTCIKADKTICFGYEKIGLYCGKGPSYAGEIVSTPIGLNDSQKLKRIAGAKEGQSPKDAKTPAVDAKSPKDAKTSAVDAHTLAINEFSCLQTIGNIKAVFGNILKDRDSESEEIRKTLDSRVKAGNKGSYGKATIIAGSSGIGGAVILSAKTAARMGLGMVKALTHFSNREALLTSLPECLIDVYENECPIDTLKAALDFADIVVLGPGLSMNEAATKLCKDTLELINKPIIIDADALNIIARDNLFDCLRAAADRLEGRIVLTPHLKEMERLTGIAVKDIKADPVGVAMEFSSKYHVICCLKDAKTVVTDAKRAYINQAGNDGMATAGSGDVLTGVLAGIFSYKFSDPLLAAITGVNIHAVAGDMAAKNLSEEMMLSGDIIKYVDEALKER
ncbi:NAD(P)H-hydrate dehydratase [Lachnospira multipara]|uniref:Bifunctional NAD(P)H-hydrate repair enzyme n=1 Tax=Lachnospira multipara TaxID=28051 RepID=A0A1H5VFR2_9FIRM|nr:NAD(P)H-hydrate dehydratase [Lachnospira multipara]SEF85886.1 NAD(P)H-hydrate epimerase [Lachnospira multipara]